jgi:hypothetical protein
MPAINASVQSQTVPAFDNMISFFLGPDSLSPDLGPAATSVTLATPSQIADAMIRSMLGTPAVLGAPAVATAVDPTTSLDKTNAPAGTPGAPATKDQMPPKQSRGITDLAMVTAVVVTPVPMPVVTGAIPAAAPNFEAAPAQENAAGSTAPPAPAMAVLKSLPVATVAFTAVLTPVNPSAIPDAGKPIAVSMEPAALSSIATVAAPAPLAAAPQENPPQPTAVLGLTASIAVQASGEKAGGETPSQQGDGSQQAPAPPMVIAADSKIKPLAPKQDEATPSIAAREGSAPVLPMSIAPGIDQVHAATATEFNAGVATAAPFQATADALRTSEPNMPAAPQPRTGIAQEISIRIAPPDAPVVDLRMVERSGQVHVDVRTSDAAMQTSLRQDLGTLTNSLQRAGYHAETFTPSAAGRTAASAQTTNQDRQDPSQQRNGSGDFTGSRRQQQQKRSGTWLEELEKQP